MARTWASVSAWRRGGRLGLALILATGLVAAGGHRGPAPAVAASCDIYSLYLTANPMGPGFRAHTSWRNCSTNYHNTLAIYEQIGFNDWEDEYGETEPQLASLSDVSIPTFATLVGCRHGIGYYKAVASIGGVTKWSAGKYCP